MKVAYVGGRSSSMQSFFAPFLAPFKILSSIRPGFVRGSYIFFGR